MTTLIGNQVRTRYSNYVFKSREEAEAFYFAARERSLDTRAKPATGDQRSVAR